MVRHQLVSKIILKHKNKTYSGLHRKKIFFICIFGYCKVVKLGKISREDYTQFTNTNLLCQFVMCYQRARNKKEGHDL